MQDEKEPQAKANPRDFSVSFLYVGLCLTSSSPSLVHTDRIFELEMFP